MAISLLGINHASAPLQLREQIAFDPARLRENLLSLNALHDINECLIISTCNRTEILVHHQENEEIEPVLWGWLCATHELQGESKAALETSYYFKQAAAAQCHLIEVACGMDSIVMGEPQIFGQVKDAFQIANEMNTARKELGHLMQFIFRTTKQIRTETGIGEHVVSYASAAMQLGKQIFTDFKTRTAILLGAGETIDLVAQHLQEHGIGRLVIANRNFARAGKLASKYHAYAIALEDLHDHLQDADILITSTASPEPILLKQDFERALKLRKRSTMFLVDLAVPRDIDPAVSELEDVYHYSIDELQKIIKQNQENRIEEAEKARRIIQDNVELYSRDKQLRTQSPLIKEFRQRFIEQSHDLFERAQTQLQQSGNSSAILEQYSTQLLNRLLHHPTALLRDALQKNDEQAIAEIMRLYFHDQQDHQ